MREPGEMVAAFPRPGRALKGVLVTVAAFAVVGAIVVNWLPGGGAGQEIFQFFAFEPARVLTKPWALFTSGLLTSPVGITHALFALVGLYFLTPDLERRWGGARLVRFLIASVAVGNLAVLAVSLLPIDHGIFHPSLVFGPWAAITATIIAWAKENQHRQIRLMMILPVSGKTLYWLTIGIAVLSLLFAQQTAEGAVAPLAGVGAGLLFGGTPSPFRTAWLRVKLALLRRKGGAASLSVESLTGQSGGVRRPPKRKGGPPLRVVQGGLEDELKNRKPPKDKRYLN
jgi:membrane associated rhomboid family serine protease